MGSRHEVDRDEHAAPQPSQCTFDWCSRGPYAVRCNVRTSCADPDQKSSNRAWHGCLHGTTLVVCNLPAQAAVYRERYGYRKPAGTLHLSRTTESVTLTGNRLCRWQCGALGCIRAH